MRKIDRLNPRRHRTETRIMLVKEEMSARHLYYSAGYLAARRRWLSATNEGEHGLPVPAMPKESAS